MSIEHRALLSPAVFSGLDMATVLLSKICLSNIGSLSASWAAPSVPMCCPSVSQLECRSIGGCAGTALLQLIRCFPSLRSLRMYNCLALLDDTLDYVTGNMRLLKELYVSKASQLRSVRVNSSDKNMKSLTIIKCPALSVVHVPDSLISLLLSGTAVTDVAVSNVFQTCRSLVLVDLSNCHALREPSISSATLSVLKIEYSTGLSALSIQCPLLESLKVLGCTSLVQLVVHSDSIVSLDLTMMKSLKSVEFRCEFLCNLQLCGCENLKYYGRYLSDDYRRIGLDLLMSSCPSLRFGAGAALAGSPIYDEYIAWHQGSS